MTLLAAFQSQRTALGDGATPDGLCWLSPPQELQGAEVRFGSVSDEESLARAAFSDPVDVVVSCLASRTGGKVTCCPLTDLSQSGGHRVLVVTLLDARLLVSNASQAIALFAPGPRHLVCRAPASVSCPLPEAGLGLRLFQGGLKV